MRNLKLTLSLIIAMTMMAFCPQRLWALTDGWTQCGTCEYLINGDGLLTIRPENNGTEGTLEDQSGLFMNNKSIKSVKFEGKINSAANSCKSMFNGCYYITSIDFANFNTDNATNMAYMFSDCCNLTSLDLSGFNTSKVTNMFKMFYNCANLASLDLSSFNTCNVLDMHYMFEYCFKITTLDLSSFNTSNVVNMGSMFDYCNSLTSLDLSSFDTGNVTNMESMFESCTSLTSLDLSSFNTGNVTKMSYMFKNIGVKNLAVGNFDMQKVLYKSNMFTSSPNSITFSSCPYLVDGTFNSLTSEVHVTLDDNSACYTGANHFPAVTECKYTRSMKNTWGTLVVPFDIKYGSGNIQCELYRITSLDDENINVESYLSDDIIPAGTPCVVRKINGAGNEICLNGADGSEISTTVSDVAVNDELTLHGSYTTLTNQTGMYYIAGDKFWKATEAITIPAFRGWFTTTASGSFAKSLSIKEVDGTDGIGKVENGEWEIGNSPCYNLSGQCLSAPQKGINIVNGRKIVIK